jgi:hypothetical protein
MGKKRQLGPEEQAGAQHANQGSQKERQCGSKVEQRSADVQQWQRPGAKKVQTVAANTPEAAAASEINISNPSAGSKRSGERTKRWAST